MKSFLFVFDFDQTLLEKNTDVDIQKLAPNEEIPKDIHDIAKSEGWTAFVNACLKYFHEQNISKDQIIEFIRNMPYVNGAIEMIKTLKHEYQADIIIVSDANSVYIEESLKNADILQCFSEIYTNPGEFREDGQLIVTPFTNQTECKLSAINQCKGKIVLDYIKDKDFAFICYAGIIKVIKEKWGQYFANNHFCTHLCSKKNGSLEIKLFSKVKSTKPSG